MWMCAAHVLSRMFDDRKRHMLANNRRDDVVFRMVKEEEESEERDTGLCVCPRRTRKEGGEEMERCRGMVDGR